MGNANVGVCTLWEGEGWGREGEGWREREEDVAEEGGGEREQG